jgi:hypothetical protein
MASARCRMANTSSVTSAAVPAVRDRLYRTLERTLWIELASGKYAVGDRLPTEREFAAKHCVSRPTAHEAKPSCGALPRRTCKIKAPKKLTVRFIC